ncbi:DNA-binding response regulator [Pseudoclavibacter endophyticus]|uniref:Response regulator transcription factor n=1 Tax=Pseudoclavibacter endophyticus TaxID=1778590 RepID=A0A6H9WGV1_9MICO|nr:response regulator transcription factor [Pseudoclavibacter endophyticus]KAB1646831.1 response regulator transcription factor [Pseudoclavibacter endophyticus]GGA75168.1 DNA-binding response regulator [Pseudoclavibacter endophyticus]
MRAAAGDGASGTIRVLVADDHESVRTGLRLLLESTPGIQVVGEAADGEQAVAKARATRPDVVLMDIRMPRLDGIEATRMLAGPDVDEPIAVVVITTFDLDEYVYGALRAGARGFLLKDAGPVLLAEAVRAAADGEALISPRITVRLLTEFASPHGRSAGGPAGTRHGPSRPRPVDPVEPLTDREEDVLRLLAEGLTNTEIGARLHVSLGTVKTHIGGLLAKLGLRNRVEAAMWAHETGRVGG